MLLIELDKIATSLAMNILNISESLNDKSQHSLADWLSYSGMKTAAKITDALIESDPKKAYECLIEANRLAKEIPYWINIVCENGYLGAMKAEYLKFKCNRLRIFLIKEIKKKKDLI